ncbi:MAG: hypothetical protein LBK73_14790 [Treponema sp.]|jgi:hypothetical protein|nr:hypothetical protein [Treponema sp.]
MKIRVMLGLLVAFLFFSCDQYPIFHAISQEVEPKEPRVKGNPTNMVELDAAMYVASRFGKTIHSYENSKWGGVSSPDGKSVMELATDGSHLYALAGVPFDKVEVYYRNVTDAEWGTPIAFAASGVIQTIRGARGEGDEGYIFASTENGLFFYKAGENDFSPLLSGLSKENIVTGAAYLDKTYYVAVVNKGIYTFDGTTLSDEPVDGTAGKPIVGMLAVGDAIVAVSREQGGRNGSLFYGDSSGFKEESKNVAFSGAMGIWRDDADNPTPSLLLVGIQSQSYSTVNGYREILLNNGSLDPNSLGLGRPGAFDVSTISNADRYGSTIELRVATSLYQARDNTLFASTMQHGLWSYRNDVWNAED